MIREFPKQPAATGRLVMRQARKAVLAGIGHKASKKDGGWPRASLVTTACDHDGPPILLLSDIALHSRDLKDDNRVSLLFDAADGHANPQQAPRISVMGRVKKTKDTDMGRRFLARHPGATLYAPFGDFNFFRMEMACAHYVGGIGIAVWLEGKELLLPSRPAQTVRRAEVGILEEMNAGAAPIPRLLGRRIVSRRDKHWRMIGLDPEGCELVCGQGFHYLPFLKTAKNSAACRRAIRDLAK